MRTPSGFLLALSFATGLYAQNRTGIINPIPAVRTFGSVLQPGGTSALPGVTRTTGSVLYPGGASPQIAIPDFRLQPAFRNAYPSPRHGNRGGVPVAVPVAVPVYIGGYGGYGYGNGYEEAVAAAAQPVQPSQPNVIVIYPPAPSYAPPQSNIVEVPREQLAPAEERVEPAHYLLAFKDKSIYSAVAYWVDGDTIHYITAGNTHNQASLSLVDRELTKRINEGGLQVKLPAEK